MSVASWRSILDMRGVTTGEKLSDMCLLLMFEVLHLLYLPVLKILKKIVVEFFPSVTVMVVKKAQHCS